MKIRTTLTLQYAGLTAAVFFVFVMAVYYVSEHSRSNAFFRNLQQILKYYITMLCKTILLKKRRR